MKYCNKCKTEKEISGFSRNKTTQDGLHFHCKSCAKIHHQLWYQQNKKRVMLCTLSRRKRLSEQVMIQKQYLTCCFCGEDNSICLDFHHTDSTKKEYNVSDMIAAGKGWKSIQQEIDKCICVCSNCHRKIHGNFISVLPL